MPFPTETEALDAVCRQVDALPDDADAIRAAGTALEMITNHLGSAGVARVPDATALTAVAECGAAVYYRRTARNGITTFGSGEVVPMRISKDPMSTVYPMLAPYASIGLSR